MTEATEPKEEKRSGGGLWWLLLLLLALAVAGAGYWWWQNRETGRFVLPITACDDSDRCGDFVVFAPGFDFAWTYGKSRLNLIGEGVEPELGPEIQGYLADAEGVIVAGLASSEGGALTNRRLSACRSMRLAVLVDDAQADLGTSADLYRVSLGRYNDPQESFEDTEVQRLVVLTFIMDADEGLDLNQALKNGLSRDLPDALRAIVVPAVRELDFRQYDCWNNEFAITPSGDTRQACYRERSGGYDAFCGDF